MNYNEIKDLIGLGFTPEQITMLTTSAVIPSTAEASHVSDPISETVPEAPTEVGEDTQSSPTEGETKTPDQDQKADPLEEIRSQLKALQEENRQLKDEIQSNNIRDRTVPTVTPPDASATLAEVIRPTFK